MAGFDLSDVLAAARGIPGAREDGRWRCVVYLSAYDWMSGWLRVPDMAAQSAACKAWLSAHGDVRKAETIRNRNAVRNVLLGGPLLRRGGSDAHGLPLRGLRARL